MGELDFLKQVEQQAQQQVEENEQQTQENEMQGWMDAELLMDQLRQAAVDILHEKNPELKDKIEQYRKEYEDVFVYFFSDDEFYIYRPITRFEYKEISQNNAEYEKVAEEIVLKAVLHPLLTQERFEKMKAGVVPTLLELILDASNFGVKNPVIKL